MISERILMKFMENANIFDNKIGKQNIGNAGEYYIASRLSTENFVTTITLGRAEKYDILAVNPRGKTIKLSVKTRYKTDVKFPLSTKDETDGKDDLYYAFILLNEFKTIPRFWIVPSKIVNEVVSRNHADWLNKKSRRGETHKDSGILNFFLKLNNINRDTYPADWEEILKTYEGNIDQLKKLV